MAMLVHVFYNICVKGPEFVNLYTNQNAEICTRFIYGTKCTNFHAIFHLKLTPKTMSHILHYFESFIDHKKVFLILF